MAENVLYEWEEADRIHKILLPVSAHGGHRMETDHGNATSTVMPLVDRPVVREILRLSAELAEAEKRFDECHRQEYTRVFDGRDQHVECSSCFQRGREVGHAEGLIEMAELVTMNMVGPGVFPQADQVVAARVAGVMGARVSASERELNREDKR